MSVVEFTIYLGSIAKGLNSELAHIHTDGKNATIKVLSQHITTKQIVIHEHFNHEEIEKAILKAIQETQAITNSRF